MVAARGRLALVLVTACALAGGCKSRPPSPPRVVEVRVVEHGGDRVGEQVALPLDHDAIARRVSQRLAASGAMVVAEGAPLNPDTDYRLTIELRLRSAPGDSGTVLRAFVSARLQRLGGKLGDSQIVSRVVAEHGFAEREVIDDAKARAHTERALDDVMDQLIALARIHTGGEKELLAALANPDDDLRDEAIAVAGDRRERAAVPALIAMLKSEDLTLRDRALGALVAIGDERAVKPITELSRLGNTTELPKVIDAMGALGGGEARAYLEFVISAHDDPEMRDLAKAALARLEKRAAEDASAAP